MQELFETLQDPGPPADAGEDNADEYQKALRTLDAHFSAQLNEPYERHVFRNLKQEEGETVDQFISRLRRQAENCNWDNADEPIRDQVIDKCRSADLSGKEAKARCYRCDREGHLSLDSCCPARNAECQMCHKIGHFAKVCQTKTVIRNKEFSPRDVPNKRRSNVNSIDDDKLRAESDEYAFTVGGGNAGGTINVLVRGISVGMLIDSGASTNVIDKGTWEELKSRRLNANPESAKRSSMRMAVVCL